MSQGKAQEVVGGSLEGTLQARREGDDIIIERRPTSTLVMLSGGIDSTYALVKLLRETDDEVLAHHIHLINIEQRYQVEAKHCRAIVAFCQQRFRTFHYSESTIDHRASRFFGYDFVSVGFEAGIVAHSYHLTHRRPLDRWTAGICVEEGRNPGRLPHVLACVTANCFPHPPPRYFTLPMITKAEEMAYLPRPVLELVWTCRTPIADGHEFRECGRCKTCELMAKVRAKRATTTSGRLDSR